MLAACTALCYHCSVTFRLESYLGPFFPLPAVLAASRWGDAGTWKTLVRVVPVRRRRRAVPRRGPRGSEAVHKLSLTAASSQQCCSFSFSAGL